MNIKTNVLYDKILFYVEISEYCFFGVLILSKTFSNYYKVKVHLLN